MGYIDVEAPPLVSALTEKYLGMTEKHLSLVAGFSVFRSDSFTFNKGILTIDGVKLSVDKIIGAHLKNMDAVAVFAASAGESFDQWIASHYEQNEQLDGYIVDTIGSEIVEAAGDWLEKKLSDMFTDDEFNVSNRLSPGYCNWHVKEQHKLFSLLPEKFCGITLNESALMLPLKSISGIMALGKNVKKLDYTCNICNLEHCYKRNRHII